ncbi:hypothetical protein [Saccharothrix sp. HUAS TT1]|uniref:hypothetical protein n=1 Tax=unclassified Saccharothrix TaxID=2593673 RepID=UPI00345BDCCA
MSSGWGRRVRVPVPSPVGAKKSFGGGAVGRPGAGGAPFAGLGRAPVSSACLRGGSGAARLPVASGPGLPFGGGAGLRGGSGSGAARLPVSEGPGGTGRGMLVRLCCSSRSDTLSPPLSNDLRRRPVGWSSWGSWSPPGPGPPRRGSSGTRSPFSFGH